jgi:hypothetical protein
MLTEKQKEVLGRSFGEYFYDVFKLIIIYNTFLMIINL